ncbi:bifunctional diaminohydroxyphosphoribosylaminopyrimidine deaminase/5-amino-6-(5-phosphoribosylamino)uracil reductase RibD [Flavihumibacter profundi]|jgi:diaminohydroxyphosphoribosylaminopyrimidine deaminase / 5-amino-6-(5-phosphoribosylamino)uracil reductase|uniref:bifunctional diaminohydroxyphosphoribosylaminopyrimidine deaminase/5-amino-6-(5-phosphoribosylamino)uracil reductase RibD n=1 Tax=Flavihumibacter profundi TaxID=2716883 RepID=UPI001CC4B1C4|nr:bifunctional diaminohydroxyphosphoribosylaminopyrimidine deaminase/5-amino-6-(5-phosphoribosylamino)uracil reductase RibD [Flavihumibacter profundi]MBZ5857210.1 bifunctional diaminohydroxyphosphoribosylaminopyrimidine deaminase/5-amino-6-(5-phosphoribosylamino)uracil reductase RibD [Flavihumibacter profundi]
MTDHHYYMSRCIQLARLGAGNVAPNPLVGSVLVYGDRIIGEGFHQQYGQPHAEVNCLASVAGQDSAYIADSILYVSLEPCAHFGKTPPCADMVIRHGIKTVVIGCRDPFPQVNGKGIEKLRAAGVKVILGVLEKECIELNKRFFCFHQKKRPFIALKWAQSANSCLAGPNLERIKISNGIADRLVHRWRSEEAAIMVGTTTALVDNPSLTNRLWYGKNPLRVLLDKDLKVPDTHLVFSGDAPTLVFNTKKSAVAGHVRYIKIDAAKLVLPQVLEHLSALQVQSVLVEGGTKLLQSFIATNCWDEARVITNQQLVLENGYPAPSLNSGELVETIQLLDNLVTIYQNTT